MKFMACRSLRRRRQLSCLLPAGAGGGWRYSAAVQQHRSRQLQRAVRESRTNIPGGLQRTNVQIGPLQRAEPPVTILIERPHSGDRAWGVLKIVACVLTAHILLYHYIFYRRRLLRRSTYARCRSHQKRTSEGSIAVANIYVGNMKSVPSSECVALNQRGCGELYYFPLGSREPIGYYINNNILLYPHNKKIFPSPYSHKHDPPRKT